MFFSLKMPSSKAFSSDVFSARWCSTSRSATQSAVRKAFRAIFVLLALVVSTPRADAQDRVRRPARGLRYLRRVLRAGPLRTTVHALFVDLCDPAVELRATAPDEGARTAGQWAQRVGAAAAINGDYFAMQRFAPLGPARGDGRWWPAGAREHRDALLVAARGGRVDLIDAPEGAAPTLWSDAERTVDPSWTEVVAARERIVVRGQVRESPAIEHDGARHPRTAVGFTADRRTLILVVVEGRAEDASGATVRELAVILRGLGAWEAVKLDGGGSSTLFIAGLGTVNHPSDGAPRVVATHLGVIVRGEVSRSAPSRCLARAPTAATPVR